MYSVEASPPYGHLWKVAIYNNVDTLFGPEYNMLLYIQNPWNAETSIFRKAEGSPVPTLLELYKIYSIIRMLVYCFCKFCVVFGGFKG